MDHASRAELRALAKAAAAAAVAAMVQRITLLVRHRTSPTEGLEDWICAGALGFDASLSCKKWIFHGPCDNHI